VGHVVWQSRPVQPNVAQQVAISLTLRAGAVEVNYPYGNTDSSGFFTVTADLAGGVYRWLVKDPKYLANAGYLTLTRGAVAQVEMGLMKSGDCTNDNVVNAQDFIIIRSSFGKVQGNPGYDDRADLNGDLVISTQDFNALKINFGQGGSLP
jgi:hypothetical protein